MDENFGAEWGGYGARSENINWLGYPFLAELSQRAEYRQITETLAKEATRKWIRVIATGDGDKSEKVARIEKVLKRHRVREKFRRLAELDGFYGRGHLFVDTGDTSDREIRTQGTHFSPHFTAQPPAARLEGSSQKIDFLTDFLLLLSYRY